MTDDELDSLVASIDDIVGGLESFQVPHADPFIEALLGDLRYHRHRLEKLIEQFRASR